MSFSKSWVYIFSGFLFSFFFFLCLVDVKFFGFPFYSLPSMVSPMLMICLVGDKTALIFIWMVFLVTSLVFLFSEFYLDSYNNKKFIILTLTFFISMGVLSLGGDLIMLMLGWDGLGISSLFLIMFYPNKISFFNSLMTFFFNRLGDVLLILFFSIMFSNLSLIFHLSASLTKESAYLVLFVCLLTKSAQFPFSSWLPAAMSAPTPISSMVHSSTLVTAGALIFFKTFEYLENSVFLPVLLILSSLTFLLGGVLGSVEMDLKKIVAFSTMSQISMILMFLGSGFIYMALSHTVCHAMFKTLLFCSCGILFVSNFSNQFSKTFKGSKNFLSLKNFFIFSIFSMSGLIFSSSFFTKDVILENYMEEKEFFLFFILILGSSLTLIYSGKIFNSFSSFSKIFFSIKMMKLSGITFMLFFMFYSLVCLKLVKLVVMNDFSCFLPPTLVLSMNFFMLIFLGVGFMLSKKHLYDFSNNVFHMKESFYSSMSLFLPKKILDSMFTDHLLFKPSTSTSYFLLELSFINLKSLIYSFLLFILILL